jgi:hypothetical protein
MHIYMLDRTYFTFIFCFYRPKFFLRKDFSYKWNIPDEKNQTNL